MNRAEFMKILRSDLRRLPEDERNSALEYYEEYFDEAGPQKEQQVLENLGNPKKIAGQIKADYAMQQLDQEEMPTAKKGWSAFKWAIVGICSAPISIPVAIVLVCVAVGVGVIAALIVTGSMKSQLKTVRPQSAAQRYIQKDSLHLNLNTDRFLYKETKRRAKPQTTSTSGSSGAAKGSGGSF